RRRQGDGLHRRGRPLRGPAHPGADARRLETDRGRGGRPGGRTPGETRAGVGGEAGTLGGGGGRPRGRPRAPRQRDDGSRTTRVGGVLVLFGAPSPDSLRSATSPRRAGRGGKPGLL